MKTTEQDKLLMTRHAYAERTAFSLRKLDTLIAEGVIPAIKFSKRCVRVPVKEADKALLDLVIGGAK